MLKNSLSASVSMEKRLDILVSERLFGTGDGWPRGGLGPELALEFRRSMPLENGFAVDVLDSEVIDGGAFPDTLSMRACRRCVSFLSSSKSMARMSR